MLVFIQQIINVDFHSPDLQCWFSLNELFSVQISASFLTELWGSNQLCPSHTHWKQNHGLL